VPITTIPSPGTCSIKLPFTTTLRLGYQFFLLAMPWKLIPLRAVWWIWLFKICKSINREGFLYLPLFLIKIPLPAPSFFAKAPLTWEIVRLFKTIWWSSPIFSALTITPLRPALVFFPWLVNAKLFTSQYSTLCSNKVCCFQPWPWISGFLPSPYESMTIGLFGLPLPFGSNAPEYMVPALNNILSPGLNVCWFTL